MLVEYSYIVPVVVAGTFTVTTTRMTYLDTSRVEFEVSYRAMREMAETYR